MHNASYCTTGAGIPDFRSPGTGLYDNLQKYDLPYPEAIFEVNYYRNKPGAFVSLANELWPGTGRYKPTLTHHFLKLLSDKGLLLRIYTQNIDGLEFLAGIPDDKLVECHGHFRTASCIDCHRPVVASDNDNVDDNVDDNADRVKETIVKHRKTPICTHCGGNVKPDIVFFGEDLPNRFHRLLKTDIPKADLLLVMGTSLQVAPVSMIPNMVLRYRQCNRVLFNRDLVMKMRKGGRDIFVPGDCDTNVQELLNLLGWTITTTTTTTNTNTVLQISKTDDDDDEESNNGNGNGSDSDSEEQLENMFAKIEINDDEKQNSKNSEKEEENNSKEMKKNKNEKMIPANAKTVNTNNEKT